jgi:ankyrin repeat protein
MTALHYAVEENHLAIVNLLLAKSQALDQPGVVLAQDRALNTPLHIASREGHVAIFQVLMRSPNCAELLDLTNDDDRNCLHVAAQAGHDRIGELLFQADARLLEDIDFRRNRPIHLAAAEGHASFVAMLLAGGAPVDVRYDINRKHLFVQVA